MMLCAGSGKQTQAIGLARNTEYQVASVKKDVPYITQHPDLDGPLEDEPTSSLGLFHECMTS